MQESQILDFLQIEWIAAAIPLLLQLLEILLLMLITLNAFIVPISNHQISCMSSLHCRSAGKKRKTSVFHFILLSQQLSVFLLHSIILLGPRSDIRISGLLHDYNTSSDNLICGLCESFAVILLTGLVHACLFSCIYISFSRHLHSDWFQNSSQNQTTIIGEKVVRKKTLIITWWQ